MYQTIGTIMGRTDVTVRQMCEYIKTVNPNNQRINCTLEELASYYVIAGALEGVNGAYAFAQSCHETGNFQFTGDVVPEQNNFAGIGTTGGGVKGHYFKTPYEGVLAQIQHLKAYATTKDVNLNTDCVDPRFHLVNRGCATSVINLSGKWAVPGYDKKKYSSLADADNAKDSYGYKIIKIHEKIKNIKTDETPVAGDIRCITLQNDSLNIRILPSGKSEDIGDLLSGNIICIKSVESNGWAELVSGGYVHLNEIYSTRIAGNYDTYFKNKEIKLNTKYTCNNDTPVYAGAMIGAYIQIANLPKGSEIEFVDTVQDALVIMSDEGVKGYIYLGTSEFTEVVPVKQLVTRYVVQAGAFRNELYARNQHNKLVKAGFDCYIAIEDIFYICRVGIFENKENAEKLRKAVLSKGFSACIKTITFEV